MWSMCGYYINTDGHFVKAPEPIQPTVGYWFSWLGEEEPEEIKTEAQVEWLREDSQYYIYETKEEALEAYANR